MGYEIEETHDGKFTVINLANNYPVATLECESAAKEAIRQFEISNEINALLEPEIN